MSCCVGDYRLKMRTLAFSSTKLFVSLSFQCKLELNTIILLEGQYYMPPYLSDNARRLINSMLAVDPVKRITVHEITQHPFFTTDLPRYLAPLPPPPGPVLGTLTSLVSSPAKPMDFEIVEGLGRIDEGIVADLAARMEGVTKNAIWECLRRDDGVQGNAVKVAYMLLKDKQQLGKDRRFP